MIFSFYFPALLAQFDWLICPADGLYIWPFPPPLSCVPNPVFIKTMVAVPFLGEWSLFPIQIHGDHEIKDPTANYVCDHSLRLYFGLVHQDYGTDFSHRSWPLSEDSLPAP